MRKTTIVLILSTFISISQAAQALELMVVNNYNQASSPEIWRKAKTDQVPDALLSNENVASPVSSYGSLFPKTFMQESLFAVCYQDCKQNDVFRIRDGEIHDRDLAKWDVVEQSNVYYWLNRYFTFLESKLNYRPSKFLKVMTNREFRDETAGKIMKNNAFFNPGDISLSFLPASKNILFKLMGGKINRSGFDPSVIVHEASHYLFHHLFPSFVNDEIGGVNEGFADYMANVFLNNPKVGLVMLHGQTLRDSSAEVDKSGRFKTYAPNMEVHDLGERVSLALWKTRELTENKNEFDRLVIDAIIDMRSNPYSGIHDFKQKMLGRIPTVVADRRMSEVRNIWETIFSGEARTVVHLDFLNSANHTQGIIGFRSKQVLPETTAKQFGISAIQESNFVILHQEYLSSNQRALLVGSEDKDGPSAYWLVHDTQRDNLLGIYHQNKQLIIDENELNQVKDLANNVKNLKELVEDFTNKVTALTELSKGKGEFSIAYRLGPIENIDYNSEVNGDVLAGKMIHVHLRTRPIIGRFLDHPEFTAIILYTAPLKLPAISEMTGANLYSAQAKIATLPEINGQRVIGYKMIFKTGKEEEVILNKINL